jgi:hypothetical protein
MTTTTTPEASEAVPLSSSIATTINGVDRELSIPRDRLHLFEAVHGSANVLLQRFRDGQHTTDEILSVLNFAVSPPAPDNDPLVFSMRNRSPNRETAIAQAIQKNGPSGYAPLVVALLIAALFGIPSDVTFSDETIDG